MELQHIGSTFTQHLQIKKTQIDNLMKVSIEDYHFLYWKSQKTINAQFEVKDCDGVKKEDMNKKSVSHIY